MKEITIKVTDDQERRIAYYLRKLYDKDKRTSLERLCRRVIFQAMADGAEKELEELDIVPIKKGGG